MGPVLGLVLGLVLSPLSKAVVLYGAFQAMRDKPVNLAESIRAGLRRFFPVVGVRISMTVLGFLGLIAFAVPGLICLQVVRHHAGLRGRAARRVFQRGRSAELPRGYR